MGPVTVVISNLSMLNINLNISPGRYVEVTIVLMISSVFVCVVKHVLGTNLFQRGLSFRGTTRKIYQNTVQIKVFYLLVTATDISLEMRTCRNAVVLSTAF